MQFFIENIVLWPSDKRNEIYSLPFHHGVVNVVHGRSGTGKSSILAIIDYCLGANRCTIPVGVIRNSVAWFGLKVNISGASYLIARRTPGNRQTSSDFVLQKFENSYPEDFTTIINEGRFKSAFNNLVRLTNLPLGKGEELGQFDGRPSYRDLAAFNFLPQHIVANPNTLFYKADSYEHKERLKKVLPFAFKIIDSEYIVKERERIQLQRQHDDLERQQQIQLRAMSSWSAEVDRLWTSAVELGLTNTQKDTSTEQKLKSLQRMNSLYHSDELDSALQSPSYNFTNERYKEAQKAEERLQIDTDNLRREIRSYERLANRALDFSSAVKEEQSHVISLEWLKSRLGGENECVVCGSNGNHLHVVLDRLESEVERVKSLSHALFENPIVDKEIETVKIKLFEVQRKLHEARMKRMHLEKIDSGAKDSLSRVYVLLGRIQALLIGLAVVDHTDELAKQIVELAADIKQLDSYFKDTGRVARERKVDDEISALIEKYASGFKLEKRGDIKLDKTELTLTFHNNLETKKEYLWEVGSGANWMGYHISTFLAIHELLSTDDHQDSPVFSFLVIDQPSQVYFPSSNSGANELDGDNQSIARLGAERDVDIKATKRIFEMLAEGLKAAQHKYQVIVLEHADSSIWGSIPGVREAANWKAEETGLIPKSWLQRDTN